MATSRYTVSDTAAEFNTQRRFTFFADTLAHAQTTTQALSTAFQFNATLTPLDEGGTTTNGVRVSYNYTPGTAGSSVSTATGVALQ